MKLLVVLCTLLLSGTVTSAVATTLPTLSVGSLSGAPGQTVTVPVTLRTNGARLSALSMDIGFNANYLSIPMNSAKPPKPTAAVIGPAGNDAGKTIVQSLPSSGLLRIGVFDVAGYSTIGDGVVAYVTFTIAAHATAPLTLTNVSDGADPDGYDVVVSGVNGVITPLTFTIFDALRALRSAAEIETIEKSDPDFQRLDVGPLSNGSPKKDGKIDLSDVIVLLRLVVGDLSGMSW